MNNEYKRKIKCNEAVVTAMKTNQFLMLLKPSPITPSTEIPQHFSTFVVQQA